MIAADQATIFPKQFFVATSSVSDGVIRHPSLDAGAADSIKAWCRQLDISLQTTVGLYITYGADRTYTDIATIDSAIDKNGASTPNGWIKTDALVTQATNIAMIVPVADCNAVVYVDPVKNVMALAHIGWHATVRNLASKLVTYFVEHYGSDPGDILIYNSPSIRADSYIFSHLEETKLKEWHKEPYTMPLPDGTYAIDLVKYNYDHWIAAGIKPNNIEIVAVDTAKSGDYPSHRMGQTGRFAVLAQIIA